MLLVLVRVVVMHRLLLLCLLGLAEHPPGMQ